MNRALRDAICNHVKGGETLNELIGGTGTTTLGRLWSGQAPTSPFPYIVFMNVTSGAEYGMGTRGPDYRIEDTLVQFSIFSIADTDEEVLEIWEALRERFDYAEFAIDGYGIMECRREAVTGPTPDDNMAWAIHADYMISTQER